MFELCSYQTSAVLSSPTRNLKSQGKLQYRERGKKKRGKISEVPCKINVEEKPEKQAGIFVVSIVNVAVEEQKP